MRSPNRFNRPNSTSTSLHSALSAKSDDDNLSDISMQQGNKDIDFIVPHVNEVHEYTNERLESIFFRNNSNMPQRSGSVQSNQNLNSPLSHFKSKQFFNEESTSNSELELAEM